MTNKHSAFLTLATALFCVSVTASPADAALIAYICDDAGCTGGGDTIVFDQGAGDNFPGSAVVGQINAGAVNVAGFTIVTNISQSKPLIGSAAAPHLDLTFQAVTSDDLTHTLYLYATDTGFTGGGNFALTMGGTQSPEGAGNTVQGLAWGGTSNNPLDLSLLLGDTGTANTIGFLLDDNGVLVPSINPFSLTIGAVITRSTAGTTTGDLDFIVATGSGGGSGQAIVPEPASLTLFGGALAVFAALQRRRTRG